MNKKILFITDIGSPWGGSEELWSKTAERLVEKGFNVSASLPWFGTIHSKVKILMDKGIQVYFRKNKLRDLSTKFNRKFNKTIIPLKSEINKRIDTIKPDYIIFSQSHIFSAYESMIYANSKGIKYFSVSQLNSELSWPNDSNFMNYREAFKGAIMNYFVSQGNLDLLQTQLAFKLENSKVIRNPYNFDSIPNIKWVENEKLKFAYVGRLDFVHKGIDILFKAFSEPEWRERNFELNIYGSGSIKLAKELANYLEVPNIKFKGHVNSVVDIWRENHILVMASRYEGMPLSMIEANFCKRPIIAPDVAGHAELIKDGITGFLYEAPNSRLLNKKLNIVWDNKHNLESMGLKAFDTIIKKYSEDPVKAFENDLLNHLK